MINILNQKISLILLKLQILLIHRKNSNTIENLNLNSNLRIKIKKLSFKRGLNNICNFKLKKADRVYRTSKCLSVKKNFFIYLDKPYTAEEKKIRGFI